MVQLWVNLPQKDKMGPPKYQAIKNADIKRYVLEDGKGEVAVVAGEYQGVDGAATTFSPVNMFNARLEKGARVRFQFPAHYNTALLVLKGEVVINGKDDVPTDHFALMANDGETFELEAMEDALVLVLSGEPLNEPIAAHGPFVMNTRAELLQAFDDFNNGKFGYLE